MENNAMSLQWKLTFQKTSRNLILAVIVISSVIILIGLSDDSCGLQHMMIWNQITSYEQSLDPELCEVIVERIDSFNEQCEPQIEILDCG